MRFGAIIIPVALSFALQGQAFSFEYQQESSDSFADAVEPADWSDFYGEPLYAEQTRYRDIIAEMNGFKDPEPSLPLDQIIEWLDKAGFRYPIGKVQCSMCKGTCNRLFSGANRKRCKYDACVKYLGGYRGPDPTPSCTAIPKP